MAMAPNPPTRKPYAAIGSAFSSSEEDTSSSSSGDEHEAEQRPATKPSIPAPEGRSSSSEEDTSSEDDDDDEGEPAGLSNVTAKRGPSAPPPHLQGLPEPQTPHEGNVPSPNLTKPSPLKRTAAEAKLAEPSPSKKKVPADAPSPLEKPAAAGEDHHTKSLSSSEEDEDSSSSGDEHEAEQRPTTNPPILPPLPLAGQEGDSSEGEEDTVDTLLPEKVVAAKKVTKRPPPKKAAGASTAVKGKGKGKEVTKQPLPSKFAAAVARQPAGKDVAYNAEKHLQEKRETYWHLAEAVNALDREHNTPGMFNAAFLNLADGKAALLNAKIKKQRMAEAKLFLKRFDIKRDVIRSLADSIK